MYLGIDVDIISANTVFIDEKCNILVFKRYDHREATTTLTPSNIQLSTMSGVDS